MRLPPVAPGPAAAPGSRLPSEWAERVLDLVVQIPPGRVLTYSGVAALLGSGGARAVGSALRAFGGGVPWWRVVRASGLPPQRHEAQALEQYRAEHTPMARQPDGGYRIDLAQALWRPPPGGVSTGGIGPRSGVRPP